jgi:hypothetical protein
MLRGMLRALVVLLATGQAARAQFNFVGPGSTAPGDYLRGVGVAAFGIGLYNLNTAQANSINVDTTIRWNEYVTMYFARENQAKAEYRHAVWDRNEEKRKAIVERIRSEPQERDLQNGDALNALLEGLNDPRIHESSFRSSRVPLAADAVRYVPFRIDAEGAEFSMIRMLPRGAGKWPVALQDARFDRARRVYERAVDAALEQQSSGKMSLEVIRGVKEAVEGLSRAHAVEELPGKEQLYRDARASILKLQAMAKLLESTKVERVMGEIDGYAGTTVNDLRIFMQQHKLRFGAASSPEERRLYPVLYEALLAQKQMMDDGIGPIK